MLRQHLTTIAGVGIVVCCVAFLFAQNTSQIGKERGLPTHLDEGDEFKLSTRQLIRFGEKVFSAKWTVQEGAGRPNVKGTANGSPLSDVSQPLVFPRNFNRISGPDSNSCAGCHNEPFMGGGGDRATEVFVLGQRFDFVSFDNHDSLSTSGAVDERGEPVTLQTVANERKTIGMNGSGYIEMLARQITDELRAIQSTIQPGHSKPLGAKGISFGVLSRHIDGSWDVSKVEGLPAQSLSSTGTSPPNLVLMPFQQAGSVVSLRQFTNNAFTQHFGIQSNERFGDGVDNDGDGLINELTRADITAAVIYQATLPVPGRVFPSDHTTAQAVVNGERQFSMIGCATCHIPKLPLTNRGWLFSEPNPYNPPTNLQTKDTKSLTVDLTSDELPPPRLKPDPMGIVWVPAYTDLKLHDITSGPTDPNGEPLDQNQTPGTKEFFSGNRRFLTRRLWGVGNSGPYMHHGKFTTMREAILAHSGEALQSREAFQNISDYDRDSIIEFLKSLQILEPGTRTLTVTQDDHAPDYAHAP